MTPEHASTLADMAERIFLQFHNAAVSSRKLALDLEAARQSLLDLHRLTAVMTGKDLEPPTGGPLG